MARKLRLDYAGACYHVINRGNYRRDLFSRRGAADAFLRCLDEACVKFRWDVHAYVVMRNHFHLALEVAEPNLSAGMKWLQGTWSARTNRFRGETGRPFQGRFKALHVEPGAALARVAHYIHLNPVRAGVVPADRLLSYRWSSLGRFVSGPRPRWLQPSMVLAESGGLRDSPPGWRSYLAYLDVLAAAEPGSREEKFAHLSRGWALGSAAFQEELRQRLTTGVSRRERCEILGLDRDAHEALRHRGWEEQLREIAVAFGVSLGALPPAKCAPAKVRLAAALKQTTSASNAWLAVRLQMGSPSGIASLVRRFRQAGGARDAEFRIVVSRFTT